MTSFARVIRRTRPNGIRKGKLALVSLNPAGEPEPGAWRPIAALQLIGGRRWSLAVVRTEPTETRAPDRRPISRDTVAEALDLLRGEHTDPSAAADLLDRALADR